VLAAAAGTIGLLVNRFSDDRAWLIGAVFILAMVLFAVYLAQVRVYTEPASLPSSAVTPVILNFMYKRRVAEVLLDVCLVVIAYHGAWRLRFEGAEWDRSRGALLTSMPIALAVQMIALFIFGAYRGAWRYFGLMDGVVFAKSVAGGTASLIVAVVYLYRFESYSRGVFVIYAALLMILLCGSRASFRLIAEFARRRRTGLRLAIYGAGEAGSLVVRELLNGAHNRYRMIGFIDDDPGTRWLRLQGYSVLGGAHKLIELVGCGGLDVVVIAARHIDPARLEAVEIACRDHDVELLRFNFQLEPLVSSA
jgi:UDP-GlcNAc:undecaprenyl-phosphate GlcNAc-1-phosphate transferase